MPSQKINKQQLVHLTSQQQAQLLRVLDKYPEVFIETPGLCTVVEHEVPLLENFRPKRLHAYKVPENLKAEVSTQIEELLHLGFIEIATSSQVSPLVCVLKPKDKEGNRLFVSAWTTGTSIDIQGHRKAS